jgi:ribosome recycling factor
MTLVNQIEDKMKAALEHLKEELKAIRTGHANPGMLDKVMVNAYGSMMKLRDIASVTTPEPRQILITPYDASNCGPIGKAIEASNIGFRPIVEANVVRINIPQMDANLRAEMVKLCHKKREESKISIRNIRRDGNELARKQKNEGDISEDVLKGLEKKIQELTDNYCKKADDLSAIKEKEVSTI